MSIDFESKNSTLRDCGGHTIESPDDVTTEKKREDGSFFRGDAVYMRYEMTFEVLFMCILCGRVF